MIRLKYSVKEIEKGKWNVTGETFKGCSCNSIPFDIIVEKNDKPRKFDFYDRVMEERKKAITEKQ